MAIGQVLGAMRRHLLLVLLVTALVVGAASWSLSSQPEVYESRAKVVLLPEASNPELVPFYGQAVDNLLPTYAQIVDSRTFLEGVARDLPFEATGGSINGSTRAEPVSGGGVIDVVGTDRDPDRAQQLAQATAEAFVARLAGNGIVEVTLLDEARVPTEPTGPRATLVIGMSVLVGLLLGGLAAIGWDRFFDRVGSITDLQAVSDVGVLASLPDVRRLGERRIVLGDPALADFEESLRTLRTNIFFASNDLGRGTTIITGLSPGDGKSTVASNLAVMTAELGLSVILVDGDVHRPVQHEIFGLANDVGLSSAVLRGVSIEQLPQATAYPNLRVVTAGPPIKTRADELHVYLEVLPRFGPMADVVLVDSPPIRAADEVRILAAFSAQVVLLIRARSVSSRQVRQAIQSLESVGATLLGLVLSRGKSRDAGDSLSYYRDYRRREPDTGRRPPAEGHAPSPSSGAPSPSRPAHTPPPPAPRPASTDQPTARFQPGEPPADPRDLGRPRP